MSERLNLPSARSPLTINGEVAPGYWGFWRLVRDILAGRGGPIALPAYTLGTLPPAADWPGGMAMATDGASGVVVVSDGASWRYMDGTVI